MKEVREVVSWPSWAGVAVPGEVVRGVRSRRMEFDWRRAELKRVFMAVYWCDTAQSDSNVGGNERRCTKYVQ